MEIPTFLDSKSQPNQPSWLPRSCWEVGSSHLQLYSYTILVGGWTNPSSKGNWLLPGLEIKQNLFLPMKKKTKKAHRDPPRNGKFWNPLNWWFLLKKHRICLDSRYPFSVSGVLARRLEEQPTGNTWATEKKTAYFRLNPGCLIGILIMVYEIILIYNWVGFHPPYTLND